VVNNYINLDYGTILVRRATSGMLFDPPRIINNFKVKPLLDDKSDLVYIVDGIYRYLNVEPVEVKGNKLFIIINEYASIEFNELNYTSRFEKLNAKEQKQFLELNPLDSMRKTGSKSSQTGLHLGCHQMFYGYDCNQEKFVLSGYVQDGKVLIPFTTK
jgi:hypothetical protein